ncbi:Uncharacterized protein ToN1_04940 [Aromatoleum petrolei]|nr:Uncharacterized protein ToN1_04940 [Aromatoleum petrolei]
MVSLCIPCGMQSLGRAVEVGLASDRVGLLRGFEPLPAQMNPPQRFFCPH